MINIETKQKNNPTNKSVLLFSGGMDSLMYYYFLKPDIILYIRHNNKYQKQEEKNLQKLIDNGFIDKNKLVIEDSLNLRRFERDDAIIPLRNLLFIALASNYGEKIYLGSMNGDRTLDKSIIFFEKMKNILDFLYQKQHWCSKRKFTIGSPFKKFTKTELVKKYKQKKFPIQALFDSYSCYEGKSKPCGWCKACFRKWVALENNKIKTKDYFKNDPQKALWLKEILPLIKKNKWRGNEDKNIIKALNL